MNVNLSSRLTLKDLVNNERTDKNTTHSYLGVYELLLKNKKNTCKNVIEIGKIQDGSIKLWYDYFPNATIHGFNYNVNSDWSEIKNDRIKLFTSINSYINEYDPSFIDVIKDIKFDFVLNNGPHKLETIKQFIEIYLPLIKDDGILVIENIPDINWLDELKDSLPDNLKKIIKTYDLRSIKNRYDDIIFVIDKNINQIKKITPTTIPNEKVDECLELEISIVINTCKQYSNNIDELIKQINIYNNIFPKKNILIVSGQEEEQSIEYIDGIKYVKLPYSGIHLTSSIYIYENIKEYLNINYWVLLPDTIQFGPNFFKYIYNYYEIMKSQQHYSLPFINPIIRPTMDMGIVHTKHIINIGDYLKKIKLCHINKDNLLKLKKQLIYDENAVLGLPAICYQPSTKFNFLIQNITPFQFITNSNSEIEMSIQNNIQSVYLKKLDLYKFQRNFNGPDTALVIAL